MYIPLTRQKVDTPRPRFELGSLPFSNKSKVALRCTDLFLSSRLDHLSYLVLKIERLFFIKRLFLIHLRGQHSWPLNYRGIGYRCKIIFKSFFYRVMLAYRIRNIAVLYELFFYVLFFFSSIQNYSFL